MTYLEELAAVREQARVHANRRLVECGLCRAHPRVGYEKRAPGREAVPPESKPDDIDGDMVFVVRRMLHEVVAVWTVVHDRWERTL